VRAARARAERNKEASLEIREGLATLCEPGAVYELRILDASREGVVSGYFDDLEKLWHPLTAKCQCTSRSIRVLTPCLPHRTGRDLLD
jgi:hypothetical protein